MQKAFHFLDGPADVLLAATVCRRWRELACAGSVWQAKAEREGILDKAAVFEVEVLAMLDGGGGCGAAASGHEEGSGVWLTFYARVFALEVSRGHAWRSGCSAATALLFCLPRLATRSHTPTRCCRPPLCRHRGTR